MSKVVVFAGESRFQQLRLWLAGLSGWAAVGVAVLPGQLVVGVAPVSPALGCLPQFAAAAEACIDGKIFYRRWGCRGR